MGEGATFGQRLRSERVAAGMSQRELARAAGVSRATITGIEIGRRKAKHSTAEAIARALGVGYADMFLEPDLFEVEFAVGSIDHAPPPPWFERRLLAHIPSASGAAVWPYIGDGVIRLRVRASAMSSVAALTGKKIEGVLPTLPAPTFRHVEAATELSVLLHARSLENAKEIARERIDLVGGAPRVKFEVLSGRLWRARVTRVSRRGSLLLQGIVPTSPIGLFVPGWALVAPA